jgi:hypothetical protein
MKKSKTAKLALLPFNVPNFAMYIEPRQTPNTMNNDMIEMPSSLLGAVKLAAAVSEGILSPLSAPCSVVLCDMNRTRIVLRKPSAKLFLGDVSHS